MMIFDPQRRVRLSKGSMDRKARERCEDGTDDHDFARQTRSLCLTITGTASTVSTRCSRIAIIASATTRSSGTARSKQQGDGELGTDSLGKIGGVAGSSGPLVNMSATL